MEFFYSHTFILIGLFVVPNFHGLLLVCWDSKCLCTALYFNKLFVSSSLMMFLYAQFFRFIVFFLSDEKG